MVYQVDAIPTTGKVVVDFFADWCGPCRRIAPYFAELEKQFPSIRFVKVNVDESEHVAAEWDVSALPSFIFFNNGVPGRRVEGGDMTELVAALKDFENA